MFSLCSEPGVQKNLKQNLKQDRVYEQFAYWSVLRYVD